MRKCIMETYRYWQFRFLLKQLLIACGVCFGLERKGCYFCKLSPKFEPYGCLVGNFNFLRASHRPFTFSWLMLFSYQLVHVRVSLSLGLEINTHFSSSVPSYSFLLCYTDITVCAGYSLLPFSLVPLWWVGSLAAPLA